MASLNRFSAIGRLTRDVELRTTPKGTPIAQFGLAINRKFKGDDGTLRDEVTFLDFEAWSKTAELCAKYIRKGSEIYVESRAKVDQWEDKATGQKRSKVKFVVETVQFLGSGQRDGAGEQSGEPAREPATERSAPTPRSAPAGAVDEDQDILF